jgi:hypothetical protein
MNKTLLAASKTKEGITKMIADYYLTSPDRINLLPRIVEPNRPIRDWDIILNKVKRPRVSVTLKAGHYRFTLTPHIP